MNEMALLVRALRGPLMLITLGSLFAIDHAGGLGIEKTWPVLIILYGVLRLVERSLSSGDIPPVHPMGPAGPVGPANLGGGQ